MTAVPTPGDLLVNRRLSRSETWRVSAQALSFATILTSTSDFSLRLGFYPTSPFRYTRP